MENQQKPKPTPIMILKIFGLSVCSGLGFAFAFYAGYNSLPYLIPPVLFLVMSCSPGFVLIRRYLRGTLFQADQLNNIRSTFYLGCVLLCLSVISALVFAITGLGHIKGFHYENYGEYIALGASVLAVFWSCVLVYDARYYWLMWQQVVGSNFGRPQIFLHP